MFAQSTNHLANTTKRQVLSTTDDPELVRRTRAARRRGKFVFWRGVFAAHGPPGMNVTDDLEDSTPPLHCLGAKSPPVTVELVTRRALSRGASIFVAGI